MSLVKSRKRRSPMAGQSIISQDPFLSDLMDTRRGIFNLNRLFNRDFENDLNLVPALNVKENDKNYEVQLAAPGLAKNDFSITVDDGILTISAEKEEKAEEEKEGFVRKEFSYNSFSRSMILPESVDDDKEIKAQYKDGVLKLTLLKKEGAKTKSPKKVTIS